VIEKLSVENFQKHRRLVVKLDARVTTFVGKSDAGKSAVLRALRFVCLNRAASGVITRGESACKVKLVAEGRKVIRRKTAAKNSYSLDGKVFAAFGKEVPAEIGDLLRVSEINFQRQHDSPYWFNETGGKVSRELNELIDLSLIDDVTSKVASEVRLARAEEEVCKARLTLAESEAAKYEYVERLDARLAELEATEGALAQNRVKTNAVAFVAAQARAALSEAQKALAFAVASANAIGACEKLAEVREKAERLKSLVSELAKVHLFTKRPVPDLSALQRAVEKSTSLCDKKDRLQALLAELKNKEAVACQKNGEAETGGRALRESLRNQQCPLCQNQIES
jgi:exonuclease SbcC